MLGKSLKLVWAALPLCLASQGALGASFDCRPYFKAKACPEIVICETRALSQQDDFMVRAYEHQMKRLPAAAALALRDEQRLWLKERSNCGCDASCISDLYEKRLNEIAEPQVRQVEDARTFHYACKSGEAHYALTVDTNRRIVSLREHAAPHTLTKFRILKQATIDECGKYGWILSGALFCIFTQGSGSLDWQGREFDCNQADAE